MAKEKILMEAIALIIGIVITVTMTLGLAGAVYEHHAALPMVAVMFLAILIFDFIW